MKRDIKQPYGKKPYYVLPEVIISNRTINPKDKLVWALLDGLSLYGHRVAFPTRELIGEKLGGLSVREVQTCTKKLTAAGLLIVDRQGGGRSNLYQTVLPR